MVAYWQVRWAQVNVVRVGEWQLLVRVVLLEVLPSGPCTVQLRSPLDVGLEFNEANFSVAVPSIPISILFKRWWGLTFLLGWWWWW